MGTTIDQLQIEIETKSDGAEKKLKSLKSTLEALDKSAKSSGLDSTCRKLEKIASLSFSNLAPLEKLLKTTEPISDMSDRIAEVTSAINDIPSQIGTTIDTGGISGAVSEIESVTAAINDVPKSLEVPVSAPGVESTNAKLSVIRRILSMVRIGASATGRAILKLGGFFKTLGISALASTKKAYKGISQVLIADNRNFVHTGKGFLNLVCR